VLSVPSSLREASCPLRRAPRLRQCSHHLVVGDLIEPLVPQANSPEVAWGMHTDHLVGFLPQCLHAVGRTHRDCQDSACGSARPDGPQGSTGSHASCQPVVDDHHGPPFELRQWPLTAIPRNAALQLGALLVRDRCDGLLVQPEHGGAAGVDDADPVLGHGTDPELRLARRAELTDADDIELRVQTSGDLSRDRDATSREGQDDDVITVEIGETLSQLLSGIGAIAETHQGIVPPSCRAAPSTRPWPASTPEGDATGCTVPRRQRQDITEVSITATATGRHTPMIHLRPETAAFASTAPLRAHAVRDLPAPPDQVFAVLADTASWAQWFPGMRRARWLTPEPHGVGSTRRVTVGPLTIDEEFVVWEPGERFAFTFVATSLPVVRTGVDVAELTPLPGDRTRLHYTLAAAPLAVPRLLAPAGGPPMSFALGRGLAGLERYLAATSAQAA
jgi:uncharacterized protein YndB with AHSA1/START domain